MEDIEKIFAVFGKLLKTSYVKLGKNSSAVYNDALIQFETAAIASSACAGLNMFELIGSKLVVEQISVEDAEILSAKVINEITLNEFSTVILENMVSVEEAEDPDFKEEVEDEAVKFGELSTSVEIVIDSSSKTVKVLLRYKNSRNARRSFKAMNGRTFGTNTVKALLSM